MCRATATADYGNRVGFWRMTDVLDQFGIVATASTNLAVFDHYPEVGAAMVERGWQIMSHGIYNTRYISSIDETAERAFYIECIEALRSHTGQQLRGMLGPAVSNTALTPDLMAEAGLIYHADWFHDDQPVPLATRSGQRLVSVPYSMELNDVPVFTQHFDTGEFVAMAKAQLDVLRREADDDAGGRVMCVALHPYLMGMPHRVDGLAAMLDYVMSHDDVWQTTASQIARHYLDHHYDDVVAHEPEPLPPLIASDPPVDASAPAAQQMPLAALPVPYEFGPAQHQHGMDHPYYEWSPLPSRGRFEWPNRSPLAIGAAVILEHVEWAPPPDAYSLRRRSGGLARLPAPDYPHLTIREYGHRVGIFRLLDLLERHGIATTVAVDALTAEHYGWLAAHLVGRGCEIAGRGIAATRLVTSKNSEADERDAIARSIDAIESATGARPTTWFSAEGVESFRTPALLAEAGIDTVLDWPNDEQPVLMTTDGVLAGVSKPEGTAPMVSLPLFLEADDEFALGAAMAPPDDPRRLARHHHQRRGPHARRRRRASRRKPPADADLASLARWSAIPHTHVGRRARRGDSAGQRPHRHRRRTRCPRPHRTPGTRSNPEVVTRERPNAGATLRAPSGTARQNQFRRPSFLGGSPEECPLRSQDSLRRAGRRSGRALPLLRARARRVR